MTNDDLWQPELAQTQWVPQKRNEPAAGRGPEAGAEPPSAAEPPEGQDPDQQRFEATTAAYPLPPAAPTAPRQADPIAYRPHSGELRNHREEGYPDESENTQNTYDADADGGFLGALRGPRRRRVLYAIGGITLLAGVGAAAVVEAADGSRSPQAAGAKPTGTPSGAPAATSPAASPSPSLAPSPSHTPMPVVTAPQWYVDDEGPMAIALTMDDGPDGRYTPEVLEIFRQYGVKATFNMIGQQIAANLSVVREVSAAGHTITNHTWNHADLSKESYTAVLSQIDRCNDALAEADQTPTIFRAPYGNWSKAVFEACAARDLRAVGWSVDPRDWDTAHVSTADIVHNVLTHTRAHSIILEHDGGGVRRNTVAALKIFIPELLERGYNFVAM